jgi:hypothetical protein
MQQSKAHVWIQTCVRTKHVTMGCDEIVLSGDAHVPIVPIHCWPKLERPSWSSLRSEVGSVKSY